MSTIEKIMALILNMMNLFPCSKLKSMIPAPGLTFSGRQVPNMSS
jgi:hypothetical protein